MKTTQEHTIVSRKKDPGNRGPAILLQLMLSLLLTLTACDEPVGNQGPQGPQGPQGLEGPEGPVGPAGEDGSMIYAGTGAPGDDIGSVGDYYLNQNTGEYYGPKDAGGWGGPIIVLKGEDGQDGQDGQDGADGEDSSQIHAGSGVPNAAVGVPGDYYLDRDNYELYGPKTSGGWGAPLNLQGPRGPAGPAGEDGSMIYTSYGPPSIDIGSPGDYYLNGTTGELYGPKSSNGWGGPILILKGEDGEDGQDGQDGADGEDGSQIYAGSGAPDAAVGVPGDYYLDRDNYELYGPKTNSGWGPPLNLRGPVGPAGEDGSIIYAGEGTPDNDIGSGGDFYLNQNTGELYGPKDAGGWDDPILVLKGEDGEDGSQIHAGSGAPADDMGSEGDFYLDTDSYELYGPKSGDGWNTPINLQRPAIYSEWIDIEWNQVDTEFSKSMYIHEPLIAEKSILDHGTIAVYLKVDEPLTAVLALPKILGEHTEIVDFAMVNAPEENLEGILVDHYSFDSDTPVRDLPGEVVRYILIPGGIPAAKMKIPDDFWNDYEAVAEYYGIPD